MSTTYRTHPNGVREVLDVPHYQSGHDDTDVATCGDCGRSWDDRVVTAITPTPSARCPFEYEH